MSSTQSTNVSVTQTCMLRGKKGIHLEESLISAEGDDLKNMSCDCFCCTLPYSLGTSPDCSQMFI